MNKSEWVLVKSEDELRPGMYRIEWLKKPGGRIVFLYRSVGRRSCVYGCGLTRAWIDSEVSPLGTWCYVCSVKARRVYRLAVPPDEAALADEKRAGQRVLENPVGKVEIAYGRVRP